MAFKFSLETGMRLADQEMQVAQGLLAREMRILQEILEQRDLQAKVLLRAYEEQKKACLEEPVIIAAWQKYSLEQKKKLAELEIDITRQKETVLEFNKRLLQCRMKFEQYKRLREKKFNVYNLEELKKEQNIIDEIAQKRMGWQ